MKKTVFVSFLVGLFMIFVDLENYALSSSNTGEAAIEAVHALSGPSVDGILDDEIWNRKPDIEEIFKSYSPTFGEPLPFKTRIWMANDKNNLYFAFYCLDSEPEKIKRSVTRHDDMWKDDWIGFNIDTIGNKKFGYVLCANPLGIQGDIFDSVSTGTDFAPDYIWYSAGRIVDDGYIVEMKIPLKGFKYQSGKNVKLNIIFERKITRLGIMGSWPQVPPGQGFFAGMASVIYDELSNQSSVEVIPSITYGNIWDRKTPVSWSKGDSSTQMGITAEYRLTSSMGMEATINPDFSQVETDAFQVLVNQRYPLFYSEKRPFFMEADKIFNLAGSGSGTDNFISAVHTRRIVDPVWGGKIIGNLKKFSFGAIAALDAWPGREDYSGRKNPFERKNALFVMGRSKVGIGADNYFGSILTSRDFSGGFNRTIGGDLYYRFGGGNHFLKSFFLHSLSRDPSTRKESSGSALTLSYEYDSKLVNLWMSYEYLDDDFQMDTAFIRRVGISKLSTSLGFNFYPDGPGFSWIKRISPSICGYYLYDTVTNEIDYLVNGSLRFNFTKQGSLLLRGSAFREYWMQTAFKGKYFLFDGKIQLTNWIHLGAEFKIGDRIYYDSPSPESGEGLDFSINVLIQPTQKLSQSFQYVYQNMNRKQDGRRIYDVNIMISRTTYQINKYLFLRAIIQYDSYLENVLTDALVSFTLIPGTVIHLGYGGFYENLRGQNGQGIRDGASRQFTQTRRSVFFKISYLFRF